MSPWLFGWARWRRQLQLSLLSSKVQLVRVFIGLLYCYDQLMSDSSAPVGRRERKKAATRQSIADAALRLFLERGYDAVSVRDVADAADVSTTTLFKHFTGKEALVFDRDDGRETGLVVAVRERPEGQGILEVLRRYAVASLSEVAAHPQATEFAALIESTPALREYSERIWTRHADSLAAAIAEQIGAPADDLTCAALARYVLDIPALLRRQPDPRAAIETLFDLLDTGWQSALTTR